ncbi:MAG: cytochrome c [Arenicellales bacterium]|jgi:mono/diheme cytochrome c family protein
MKHLLTALLLSVATPLQASEAQLERGRQVFNAASCAVCHTDKENNGEPLAGGYAMKSDFGTFYTPNITPDPETGIGNWSDEDFIRALQQGISPQGDHYFPSFPYTAYTKMHRDDVLALKAYLFSLKPVKKANREHDLAFYVTMTPSARIWKSTYFKQGEFIDVPGKSAEWNRGAYLVEAMGHCSECHTPRKALGALDEGMAFAGVQKMTGVGTVPNITPDKKTGIGRWSVDDLVYYFETGTTLSGDSSGGKMASIIDNSLSLLPAGDRKAIAVYLLSQQPIENSIKKKKKKREKEEFE